MMTLRLLARRLVTAGLSIALGVLGCGGTAADEPVPPLDKGGAARSAMFGGFAFGREWTRVQYGRETHSWMGRRGSVTLLNHRWSKMRIIYHGFAPTAELGHPSNVRVFVDGHEIDRFEITAGGFARELIVPREMRGQSDHCELTFDVDSALPHAVDGEHGLALTWLVWEPE